ncbi:MAG: cation diffusion facilitator family transporter [Candidatus Omnitrophota bacterium]
MPKSIRLLGRQQRIEIFVKNGIIQIMVYSDPKHYRIIKGILLLTLALNWTVAFAKIIYGLFSKCSSMAADGFHSLSDGASNIIGIIGITLSSHPRDKDHPYGHKKYETFFSLGIAALLFLLAFQIIEASIERFRHPVLPQVGAGNFAVMLVTIAVNFWVMNYERRKGRELKSDFLIADAMHTRADIFTSLSVIITLFAIKSGFPILDPVATILIALFIVYAALEIVREGARVLCDTAAIIEDKRISDIVLGVNGVKACHKIRSRGRPDDINIDLHVQVAPDMHIEEAHKISYHIEEAIKKGIPEVSDVVVHMEPREKRKNKK